MTEKIVFDDDCEFIVSRIVNTTIDEQGRKIKQYADSIEGDLSLGSMKEPKNTDVIAVEWRDTQVRRKPKRTWLNSK